MDEVLSSQPEPVGNAERRLERVVFETDRQRVEGDLTLPPAGYQSRFSDMLNRNDSDFVAVTNATITAHLDGSATQLPFLVVSKRHIRFAYSLDD
ncbi:MAG: hypothetical protein ACM3JL_01940 [Nitrososphaerota archaeon]